MPTTPTKPHAPALRGGALALLAAALFGISTPLVQLAGLGLGAFSTAALLYAGAGALGFVLREPVQAEAGLARGDWPRIVAMACFGAVIGPVALVWGLQHTSGTSASLMLTLEALFTAVLAWRLYHETMDRRVCSAMLLLLLGGAALVLDQSRAGQAEFAGLLAVLVATLAWGIDNTLSRAVADRDPSQVVLAKSVLGSAVTLALAFGLNEPLPSAWAAGALLAIGAAGYGLSLRFYLLAQRSFGAARTGSVFAFAPFIGAVVAYALGERAGSALLVLGGVLMLAGVALHLLESHAHAHVHDAMTHEHAHSHDDGHHGHSHAETVLGSHNHLHQHSPQQHAHPHTPDLHHGHAH